MQLGRSPSRRVAGVADIPKNAPMIMVILAAAAVLLAAGLVVLSGATQALPPALPDCLNGGC
jgi:hypothetical protein